MQPRKEMQLRLRSKVIRTKEGQALTFGFKLGPVSIFCIANLPEKDGNQEGPLVYVKMDLRISEDWEEHSMESGRGSRG